MAVIHISEAEAALNFADLISKVRAGEEVRIETEGHTVAVLRGPEEIKPLKTLSEAIRLAEERDDDVTLDDQFSRDLEAVITNHEHEAGMRDRWSE